MFSKAYLADVAERCIRSFAGGYAAQGVVGDAAFFSSTALQYGLAAAGASLLFALAGKPFGKGKETASVL